VSAYATAADFDAFGISPAALPDSILDSDKLRAVQAASGRADSYLGARFRLPLISWGADLSQAVCAIAAFELVATKVGFNPDAAHNQVLIDRKEDAIRWLEQVSRAHVMPSGVVDSTPPAASVARVYSNKPRGF
jgi:phage gp36-like protein